MEPRPFSRGDTSPSRPTDTQPRLLQWSRDLSVAETRNRPRRRVRFDLGFNGAATFQSRRRQSPKARPASTTLRFNGAATFQSRRLGRLVGKAARGMASMEPRPFSRGDSTPSTTSCPTPFCFNGAATFQSRRRVAAQSMSGLSSKLQWSRDLSVAETMGHLAVVLRPVLASMEPRPFSRGDMLNRSLSDRV